MDADTPKVLGGAQLHELSQHSPGHKNVAAKVLLELSNDAGFLLL